jgi:hypothetical protein
MGIYSKVIVPCRDIISKEPDLKKIPDIPKFQAS